MCDEYVLAVWQQARSWASKVWGKVHCALSIGALGLDMKRKHYAARRDSEKLMVNPSFPLA